MQNLPALAAREVHKRFKIPEERSHTLKERALHPLRRSRHDELYALKDISFSVALSCATRSLSISGGRLTVIST